MNKKLIQNEIRASEEAIKSLIETRDKCINGIEIQEFVLNSFKKELKKL